jgi:hypothetical protein
MTDSPRAGGSDAGVDRSDLFASRPSRRNYACRFSLACQREADAPDRRAGAGLRCRWELASRRRADRDHRGASGVDRFDDFGVVDALQIDRGDAEVAVSELPLDDDQRDAFAGHLDRVCVPQLVRREASANPGSRHGAPELGVHRWSSTGGRGCVR